MMKVTEAKLSLLGKARARPDQVRKVIDSVAQQGPAATYKKAMNRLDSYTPLGYSLCGVVVEVGAGAEEFRVGQLVAAAGNEFALHAEVNWVPVNLCVPVPDGVAPEHAAFATVGAIAMQGVRRAEVAARRDRVRHRARAGRPAGGPAARRRRRPRRRRRHRRGALPAGREGRRAARARRPTPRASTQHRAGAARSSPAASAPTTSSSPPAATPTGRWRSPRGWPGTGPGSSTSARPAWTCPWNDYYDKELDVRFSRSYGPGRYDDRYELDGIDYPVGLRPLDRTAQPRAASSTCSPREADRRRVPGLRRPPDRATRPTSTSELRTGALHGVGFLFEYPRRRHRRTASEQRRSRAAPVRRPVRATRPVDRAAARLGFIGAGNYATSMLLPAPRQATTRVELATVATTRSLSAVNAQRKFGFERPRPPTPTSCSTTRRIDAVFVVTRHHSHADLVCRALERGQGRLRREAAGPDRRTQLDRILDDVERTGNDRLMVGFNRRFAPLFTDLRARFGAAGGR